MAQKHPAIFLLIALIFGIVFADITELPSWLYMALAIILFLGLGPLLLRRKVGPSGLIFLTGIAVLSAFNYSFQYQTYQPGHIRHFADDGIKYTIYGTIDDWPNITEHRTVLYLQIDSIGYENRIKQGRGRLLLNISMETTSFQYGDRIYFDSEIYSIKGGESGTGFNYQRYLNLKEVFATAYLPHFFNIQIDPAGRGNFYRLIDQLRSGIMQTFNISLDKNASALAGGFLIGVTKDISPEIYQLFRDTGTLHLLAVSGSNVGLVIVFFVFLFRASPYRRITRTVILLILIIIFSFLAYNQPSVVRASVMASLVLLGKMFQRRIDLNNIIAATAAIILLFAPSQLYDVGFQLSFVTAWGLIYFVPQITSFLDYSKWHPSIRYIFLILIVSTIAQIVILPMSAFYFQRFPAVSFLSNIIIVPLVSVIVIGEVILLLVGFIFPIVGQFIGSLLNPLINSCIYLLEFFGSDNVNFIFHYSFGGWILFFYYIILFVLTAAFQSKLYRRLLILTLLLGLNVAIILPMARANDSPDISIISAPGGFIFYSDFSEDVVAISDLTQKDYSISEKIIYPFLVNKNIRKPRIISLSGNFNNVQEALILSEDFDSSSVYFNQKAVNMVNDYYNAYNYHIKNATILYYGDTVLNDNSSANTILLSRSNLTYIFDSTVICVANEYSRDLTRLFENNNERDIILIIPVLDEIYSDIIILNKNVRIKTIICNHIQKQVKTFWESPEAINISLPEIVELSQVGVVEMDNQNGRILIRR
ncbi:MAG: ComEC/Rec2 family competence protein [Candidatus Zixiibacteriota bacterium]